MVVNLNRRPIPAITSFPKQPPKLPALHCTILTEADLKCSGKNSRIKMTRLLVRIFFATKRYQSPVLWAWLELFLHQ